MSGYGGVVVEIDNSDIAEGARSSSEFMNCTGQRSSADDRSKGHPRGVAQAYC